MQISSRRPISLIARVVGFLIVVVGILLIWPDAAYDPNNVHPAIRGLAAPYQSVFTGCYADGGSISIRITDRDGRILLIALPIDEKGGYSRLFLGAEHISEGGAEIEFSEETRRMLSTIIEQYPDPIGNSDRTLISLRGSTRDFARILSTRVKALLR